MYYENDDKDRDEPLAGEGFSLVTGIISLIMLFIVLYIVLFQ